MQLGYHKILFFKNQIGTQNWFILKLDSFAVQNDFEHDKICKTSLDIDKNIYFQFHNKD